MIAAASLAIALSAAGALPLKPGEYVPASSPCRNHANAAEFNYDGRAFSYPHASRCLSTVRSHKGSLYRIDTTCSALGDGTPAPPTTMTTTYRTISATRVSVSDAQDRKGSDYRWCPAQ